MKKILLGILTALPFIVNAQLGIEFKSNIDSVSVGDLMTWDYVIKDIQDTGDITLDFDDFKVDNVLNQKDSLYSETTSIEILEDNQGFNKNKIVKHPKIGDTIKLKVAVYDIAVFSPPIPKVTPDTIDVYTNDLPVISVLPSREMMNQDTIKFNKIADIIKEKRRITDFLNIWYLLVLMLPVILWLTYSNYFLNNPTEDSDIELERKKEPSHLIALRDLESLKEKSWEADNVLFHTELTRIIRQYIHDRYGINAPDMTTFDTLERLKENEKLGRVNKVSNILQCADLVKFAKGEAGVTLNKSFLEDAFLFVDQTRIE